MADISSPKEFLQEAMDIIDGLKADRDAESRLESQKRQLEKSIDDLTKKKEQEKTKTIQSRRTDVETGFDKRIRAVDSEITKISNNRAKARDEAVRNRIETQTEGFKQEKETYKKSLSEYCKAEKLPGICRTGIYYKLFYPSSFSDWLLIVVIAAVMAGMLVGAFKINRMWFFVFVVLVEVVIIALYVLIFSRTRGKYPSEVRYCADLIKKIRDCRKKILNESKTVKKDKNDTFYNLESFDNEIAEKNSEKSNITEQKTAALYKFDNITKNELLAEIDKNYEPALSENKANFESASSELAETKKRIADAENRINNDFIQYIGNENLNHDRLDRMIKMLESGEAVSVSDAISKLQ